MPVLPRERLGVAIAGDMLGEAIPEDTPLPATPDYKVSFLPCLLRNRFLLVARYFIHMAVTMPLRTYPMAGRSIPPIVACDYWESEWN
jgi:hypothetical protein